jgi:hypothetical protein
MGQKVLQPKRIQGIMHLTSFVQVIVSHDMPRKDRHSGRGRFRLLVAAVSIVIAQEASVVSTITLLLRSQAELQLHRTCLSSSQTVKDMALRLSSRSRNSVGKRVPVPEETLSAMRQFQFLVSMQSYCPIIGCLAS